jgi:DNA-binding transcriptional LysR family regulator
MEETPLTQPRFDELEAFVAVAESGGVSGAARRLGVAKSMISKRVAALEQALGATLLQRLPRAVTLTDRGRAFYERARAILGQLDEAAAEVRDLQGSLRGLLRIAAPLTFGTLYLGDLLWPFLRAHPLLEVALDLDDRIVDLLGSGYDLGIRIGSMPDSSMVARVLADMPLVLCASPAYLDHAGAPATVEDLPSHACIGYAHLAAGQVWRFRAGRGGAERAIRVQSRFVANNAELMRGAAVAGLGLLMVPEFVVARELRDGTLLRLLPDTPPVGKVLHALYPRDRQGSTRVRALVDHLVDALSPQPPWVVASACRSFPIEKR